MIRRTPQSGFALLITLALVMLAGVALVGLAQRSMTEALTAQTATQELQRKWAVISCRDTLLGRTGALLDDVERERIEEYPQAGRRRDETVSELRVNCQLSGIDYEFIFTDEQAKVNVNQLLKEMDRGQSQTVIARLIASPARASYSNPLNLRTVSTRIDANNPGIGRLLKIGSYGQIFENVSPDQLAGTSSWAGLAADLTCWGDGRINLRRASTEAIKQALAKGVGMDVVSQILAAKKSDPYAVSTALLGQVRRIDQARMTRAIDSVTDESDCFGLWVIAHGPQRSWHTLAVAVLGKKAADAGSQGQGARKIAQRYEFAW